MKFLVPSALWLLLLIPVLYGALLWDERRRKALFERFAKSAVWPLIAPGLNPYARLRKARLWLAALGFAVLALARPQWGTHEETATMTGLDLMVAIDLSNSMEVEDVAPNRLRKAKHLIRSLDERLHGDRVGLIGFAGSAYIASPLTNDLEYVSDTLEILTPHSISNQGTDISSALDTAKKALERGAEEPGGSDPSGAQGLPSKVVVLISDGEDHEGGATELASQLNKAGIKLYVIGVGTQKGGPIPIRDDSGNLQGYKRDRKGQPIVSSFRPDALAQLASAAGGKFWNATPDETELDELLQDLNTLNRADYAERRYLVYEDRFQIPLAIAVLLLLLEWAIPSVTAVSAGQMITLILLTGLAGAPFRTAQAAVPLDAYIENRKGLEQFGAGNMDEAKKHFGAAQAIDPTRPELEFNQGVIQMNEGDAENAIQSFGQAAKESQANPRLNGAALFNLGGALSKKGDTANAIRSYLGSIQSAQRANDPKLEEDARKNLELLIRQQQKQKQQQDQKKEQDKQQQQQKQDQQKKDPKDQKQDQQKKEDQKNQENQKEQPKQYEDPKESRKRQFRSPKLSREDAERVMAELKNREKELQNKLMKQQGNARGVQKDW